MKIKKTEAVVAYILKTTPEARDNDDVLYWTYIVERVGYDIAKSLTMWDILMNRNALGLASIETVGRCRRRLQKKYEELRATASTQAIREAQEDEFRQYAKN